MAIARISRKTSGHITNEAINRNPVTAASTMWTSHENDTLAAGESSCNKVTHVMCTPRNPRKGVKPQQAHVLTHIMCTSSKKLDQLLRPRWLASGSILFMILLHVTLVSAMEKSSAEVVLTAKYSANNSFDRLAKKLGVVRRRLPGDAKAKPMDVDTFQAGFYEKIFNRHEGRSDRGRKRGWYWGEVAIGGILTTLGVWASVNWASHTLPFMNYHSIKLATESIQNAMPGLDALPLDGTAHAAASSNHNMLFDTQNTLINMVENISLAEGNENIKATDINFQDFVDEFQPLGYIMAGTLMASVMVFGLGIFVGYTWWFSLALTIAMGLSGLSLWIGLKDNMEGIAEAFQEDVIEAVGREDALAGEETMLSGVVERLRGLEDAVRAAGEDSDLKNSELLEYTGLNGFLVTAIVLVSLIGIFIIWGFVRKFVCNEYHR